VNVPNRAYYFEELYPLQDQALRLITGLDTGFHLTGGTAASRGYLQHRFSDDLDLFVNDDNRFGLWAERVVQTLAQAQSWGITVLLRQERFFRLELTVSTRALKIELVNDVPSRVGSPWLHPVLGWLDTAENILANKVSALLDRQEPKDLADIWGFCCRRGLSLEAAITGAQGKAAGIFPVDLARLLCTVTRADWEVIRWIEAPSPAQFVNELQQLGERLILGGEKRAL
jgi:hypothetical protein